MSKRLSGRKIRVENPPTDIYVYRLNSMEEAVECYYKRGQLKAPLTLRRIDPTVPERMLKGDHRLQGILATAEQLIDEALLYDPRLVRRPAWIRSEEGLDACPCLIASGEERAALDWRRTKLTGQATMEPVKIVVSTDTRHIKPSNASAFIAAARLAQQFRPLEIWWQGAWLREAGTSHPGMGHIILVPLIRGDMDYSRIQFVLSDELRDHASYSIMVSYAWPAQIGWGSAVGTRSYLEGTFAFIRETGIDPSPATIATMAAHWAGLETREVNQ